MENKGNYMKSKYQIGVFCTEADLQHPILVQTAVSAGIISSEAVVDGKVSYNDELLSCVLEKLFGFNKGNYESSVVPRQKTRLNGKEVVNNIRYIGVERQDKDWIECGMASPEVVEVVKYGEPL